MADEAANHKDYDFWCDECMIDFTAYCHKHIHRLYGDAMVTYRAYCPKCGDECVRLLTHRDNDPYYYLSDKINRQRNEFYLDMLTPDMYGFKSMYGEGFEEYTERLIKSEEKKILAREGEGFKQFL